MPPKIQAARAIHDLLFKDKLIELPRSQAAWAEKRIEDFATVSRGHGEVFTSKSTALSKWVAPAQKATIGILELLKTILPIRK